MSKKKPKLKRYWVHMGYVVSHSVVVEAENEDNAEEKAVNEHEVGSLCWQCSRMLGGDLTLDEIKVEEASPEDPLT